MKKTIHSIVGTCYFESFYAAKKYYNSQWSGQTTEDIQAKIDNKEIYIGKPEIKENEELAIDKDERRYKIITYK